MIEITTAMLDSLRAAITDRMSPKRLAHTLAVEDMVARLCALFCPEEERNLRAAALLHDITKELSLHDQVELSKKFGLTVLKTDLLSPKTFHARTAAALIPVEFLGYAHPTVINAVRWHTTGREGMTLTERLLYLADYIDDSRTFESCVMLRNAFWGENPQSMTQDERLVLLQNILLLSFDMTMKDLLDDGFPIALDTVAARNELIAQIKEK